MKKKRASDLFKNAAGKQLNLSPEEQAIQNLLNSAIVKQLSEDLETRSAKESQRDLTHLAPILTEYLNNFIVIGHDLMGNEVYFSFAKDTNDKNAISKLFHDTFIRMMISQQNDK